MKQGINLGHKPDMDEVMLMLKSIIGATDERMDIKIDEYKNSSSDAEKYANLISLGNAFGLKTTAQIMKKFIETGEFDANENDEGLEELITKTGLKKKFDTRYGLDTCDEKGVEDAYKVIEKNICKTLAMLADKYSATDAVKLMSGYCELFAEHCEELVKEIENDENSDSDEIKFNKEDYTSISVEDAIKEMEENGDKEESESLKKFFDEIQKNGKTVKAYKGKNNK